MTTNRQTEVVVVPLWNWDDCAAVLTRGDWDYINGQLDLIWSILRCNTWGEYRHLNVTDEGFQELVYQETEVEVGTEPTDDAPFRVDLSKYEDYDRDQWLQRATTDLFDSIGDDDTFPWDLLFMADISTRVEDGNIEAVIQALEQRGFHVTKVVD